MKFFLETIKTILLFAILTVLTQTGGISYLVYKPIGYRIKQRAQNKKKAFLFRFLSFFAVLTISAFVIIPPIAKQFGRVPLPLVSTKKNPIRPANLLTCIANRHYVKPELLNLMKTVAMEINIGEEEKTKIIYLDANFPFWDEFPLLPHISHDDGKKIDFLFLYKNKKTGKRANKRFSLLGYGITVLPKKGEVNMPAACKKKGYSLYSAMSQITSQRFKKRYEFDLAANKKLLKLIASKKACGKIFIEPHLKDRLGLGGFNKIRFHGCKAVRHDDHIHVQL